MKRIWEDIRDFPDLVNGTGGWVTICTAFAILGSVLGFAVFAVSKCLPFP